MDNTDLNKNNNKKLLWIITSCVFIFLSIVLAFIAYCFLADFYPSIFGKASYAPEIINKFIQKNKNNIEFCHDCVRRNIDGVYVKRGQENLYPIAVIIENHVDSRPSFALSKANLVFEAEAEGGITRFLAIFADGRKIDKIGPVRSARPYFIDWARELSALFVHCGGSPEALVKIARENIFNLNEFYQGSYFWRDKTKFAPHNIYISSDNINKYLASRSISEGKFLSWQFKDDAAIEERPDNAKITINYKSPDFTVDWIYDRKLNNYIRYLAGQRHKDASGKEIRAKNIIIEYIEARVIDEELRLKMNNIGTGKAVVCLDGKCSEGSWHKKTSSSRTRFYDQNNEEFKFNAGTTWIEVVRPELDVSY